MNPLRHHQASTPDMIIPLLCAGCGATLDITPQTDRFASSFCGLHQQVERRGGVVALKQVGDAIGRVQNGTDRTAAELAVRRLKRELEIARFQRHQLHYPPGGMSQREKAVRIPIYGLLASICLTGSLHYNSMVLLGFGIVTSLMTAFFAKTLRMSKKDQLLLEQLNGQIQFIRQQTAANRAILDQPL